MSGPVLVMAAALAGALFGLVAGLVAGMHLGWLARELAEWRAERD